MLKSFFLLSTALLLVTGSAMAKEKPAADAINGVKAVKQEAGQSIKRSRRPSFAILAIHRPAPASHPF